MPHFYIYSTSNVGEAMMAKRRSYAGIINYLTPPFMESNVRGIYKNLADAINEYNKTRALENPGPKAVSEASRLVKNTQSSWAFTVNCGSTAYWARVIQPMK